MCMTVAGAGGVSGDMVLQMPVDYIAQALESTEEEAQAILDRARSMGGTSAAAEEEPAAAEEEPAAAEEEPAAAEVGKDSDSPEGGSQG